MKTGSQGHGGRVRIDTRVCYAAAMQRFTISLEEELAADFDAWMAGRTYANRSEAVRDLLRAELERSRRQDGQSTHCVASLSYVYKHHERALSGRLNSMQHEHHDLTVSTMHAHLDHEHCLETVILRGPTAAVQRFADAVCAERGVHHGHLNLISVQEHGEHVHEHADEPGSGLNKSAGKRWPTHSHIKPAG